MVWGVGLQASGLSWAGSSLERLVPGSPLLLETTHILTPYPVSFPSLLSPRAGRDSQMSLSLLALMCWEGPWSLCSHSYDGGRGESQEGS